MFQLLDYLTFNKKPWNSLSESEKKSFNVFIMHRMFSMDEELMEIVAHVQKYSNLSTSIVYNIWFKLLPKQRLNIKYIKKTKKEESEDLIKIFASYYQLSIREMTEYIDFIDKDDVIKILHGMGYTIKEVKKLLK